MPSRSRIACAATVATAIDSEATGTGRMMIPIESDMGPTRVVAIDE